jgi:hypothetical protein
LLIAIPAPVSSSRYLVAGWSTTHSSAHSHILIMN